MFAGISFNIKPNSNIGVSVPRPQRDFPVGAEKFHIGTIGEIQQQWILSAIKFLPERGS